MITTNTIITGAKAGTGIGLIEATQLLSIGTPDTEVIKLLCQAVITIATIISLFIKNKKPKIK